MKGPAPHTAENATPGELWRASLRLLLMLAALALLVVPLIRELPLGQSTRIGILAWLLVGLSLYWLYGGLSILMRVARTLILVGAAFAGLNLAGMVVALIQRWARRSASRQG
jgi:hypothetical protein